MKKYKTTYIFILIIFIFGFLIGLFLSSKISEEEKNEIKIYIENGIQNLKIEDRQKIFLADYLQNLKFIFLIGILGFTVIAGFLIYLVIFYKGFCFGFNTLIFIKIFGSSLGTKYLFLLLILKNLLIFPIIFLVATSGIRINIGIIKRNINLKYEIIRHILLIIILLVISIISSCIESYLLVNFL